MSLCTSTIKAALTAGKLQKHNMVYFKHFPFTFKGVYEWRVTIFDTEFPEETMVFYAGLSDNIQNRIVHERTSPNIGLGRIFSLILDQICDQVEAVFSVRACNISVLPNLVECCLLKTYDYCGNRGGAGLNGCLRPDDVMIFFGFQKYRIKWDEILVALRALDIDPEDFKKQLP